MIKDLISSSQAQDGILSLSAERRRPRRHARAEAVHVRKRLPFRSRPTGLSKSRRRS
ncbi:MAG: hypothetical protein MZU95_01045 [Desulfomicrobium escambiense]|nr:hypothetical protein [Desulfomicrobium escambiense]